MLNCGLLQGTKEEKISSGVFMEESTLRVTDEQGKGCRSRKTRPQALGGGMFPCAWKDENTRACEANTKSKEHKEITIN